MKRLFIALALIFTSGLANGQTVTVTGHTVLGTGATASSGVSVIFELTNDNAQQCRVNGTGLIVPTNTPLAFTQAQLAAGISLYPNSSIVCGLSSGNTRWRYTLKFGGVGVRQCSLNITSNLNLDSATCLNATATPTTTVPTASLFWLLDGSNSPSGNFVPLVNGTQSIGTSGARWNVFANTLDVSGASSLAGITATGDYINTALATMKWGSSGTSTPDSGISRIGPASIAFGNGTQGNNTANLQAGSFYLNSGAAGAWGFITSMFDQISTGCARWSSGANATTGIDSGICRGGAPATVAIGNGTAGDASGTIKVAKIQGASVTGSSLGGLTPSKQIFTSNGTFTIPAGVTAVKVTVVGAGGAGGGGNAAGSGNGGGGAAGGAGIKWLSGLTPGNTLAVTVGTGGTGASGTTGNSGTSSSVASGSQTITTITANGGVGGSAGAGVANAAGAVETAAGTGGDINLGGAGGGFAFSSGPYGGPGGNSIFGGAGGNAAGIGHAAVGLGSGGGGAASNSTQVGGAGGGGVVIFEWVQ